MKFKTAVIIVLAFVLSIITLQAFKGCNHKDPINIADPVVSVTPIVDKVALDKLPELPNNEKPVTAVPVKVPDKKPGVIIEPAVVVSSAGNTYVVYSERIECGFKFDVKASAGISDKLLLGADVTFFSWWRLNTDALAYIPISDGIDFYDTRIGVGVSYQVLTNTSAGVGYITNMSDDRSWLAFVSVKF